MRVNVHLVDDVVVVGLQGHLTVETDVGVVHRLVGQMARRLGTSLVLDLEHVTRIDCAGIGHLVLLHNKVRDAGGTLRLVCLRERQKQLLELLQMHNVFWVFDDKNDAVASCKGSAGRAGRVSFRPPKRTKSGSSTSTRFAQSVTNSGRL